MASMDILIEKYEDLLRLAKSYLRNQADAEDVLQDVTVELLEHQDKQRNYSYLKRLVRDRCLNYIRDNKEIAAGPDPYNPILDAKSDNHLSWALGYRSEMMGYNAPENY